MDPDPGHVAAPGRNDGLTHFCGTCGTFCSPAAAGTTAGSAVADLCVCCACAVLHEPGCWQRNWAPAWWHPGIFGGKP